MKYVYQYDEKTKEYLGKAEALLDPLESQLQQKEIYLLPANATFSAPSLQEGYVSVLKKVLGRISKITEVKSIGCPTMHMVLLHIKWKA